MTKIPWTFRIQPDPDREYLVIFTSGLAIAVSWRNLRKLWAFQQYTRRILEKLNESDGCVGFALGAKIKSFEGMTISVWEDIESLRRFQKEDPHKEAMDAVRMDLKGKFQYLQWKSRSDAFPRTWTEAEAHLKPREQPA
jgi:quinol monooxygenase YgiN